MRIKDKKNCKTLQLPTNHKNITFFLNRETGQGLTLESKTKGGLSNDELNTLHLDRLSPYDRVLRRLGLLSSTLYVLARADD